MAKGGTFMGQTDASRTITPRIFLGDRPPSYVSKATLAAELDIGESTVDDYVRRGVLPKPIRIGGNVRWCWAQIQASLASLTGSAQHSDNDPFMKGVANVKTAK
jgi:predicted DNA-binding transcriptional regulator AlpA